MLQSQQQQPGYTSANTSPGVLHFQGITLIVSMALFLLASFLFIKQARTPSDQNWFRNPPSNIYVSSSIPTISEEISQLGTENSVNANQNTVPTGSFIVSIARNRISDISRIQGYIEKLPENAPVEIDYLDTRINKVKTAFVAHSALLNGFVYKIESVVLVIDVQQGGVSDRAGMKAGDLIVQIDNRAFKNAYDADAILRTIGPGETTTYDVLRNGEIVRLYLTMASFGFDVFDLLLLLTGGISMGIGVFIALKSPHVMGARILGWAILLLGYSLMSTSLIFRSIDVADITLKNIAAVSEATSVFLFVLAWYYFPKYRTVKDQSKWWILGFTGIIGALYVVFSNFNFDGNAVFIGLNILMVAFPFFWFIPKSNDAEYKRIGKKFAQILAAMLLFQLLLAYRFYPTLPSRSFFIFPKLLEFAIPISVLYLIGRFRLLDIDITVRRRIQYWFVTLIWASALLCVGLWLFWFIPTLNITVPVITLSGTTLEVLESTDQAYIQTLERSVLMGIGVGIFVLFLRTARWGQNFINKKYHRSNYDYRDANRRLGEITSTNVTVDALSKRILTLVSELMLVRNVALVLKNEEVESFEAMYYRDGELETWNANNSRFTQLFQALRNVVSEVRIENLPKISRSFCVKEGLALAVPLWSKKRMYGILLLGEKLSEDAFDQEDVSFLNLVSHQSTIAFDNAFLYKRLATQERLEHELHLARIIQLQSLPQERPNIEGLDISASSEPAFEVGGDYFDYLIQDNNKITTVVGDVSGKGTSAALYLSKVQGIIRTLHVYEKEPKGLIEKTNALLVREIEKKSFVTALVTKFDTEKRIASIVRAGHLPLYRYNAKENRVDEIQPPGMGMGITTPDRFNRILRQIDVPFESGDIYLLISDGVTELKPKGGEEFGEHRVKEILSEIYALSASKIRSHIVKELKIFNRGMVPNDDQTIVVVKIL